MNEMKKVILTIVVLAVGFSAIAQSIYADSWDPDADADGNVGVTDLLALLSVFGDYDLDNDGIWDSVDDCVGEYDECGVCNGGGILGGFCSCDGLTLDAIGECGGNCLEDYDGDGICDEFTGPCFGAGEITYFGHSYELVEIGEQCWFQENLKTSVYRNGDEINTGLDDGEWGSTEEGAYAVNENYASYLEHFGILYNFYAVSDSRGLCPNGWHVPNDGDWQALELYLGMQASQINQEGWRSSGDVGLKLKASSETLPIQWNGNDQSNFEALPGGFRDASGGYINIWNFGIWWTSSYYGSSSSASEGFRRLLHTDQVGIGRWSGDMNDGYSIRCLKDSE